MTELIKIHQPGTPATAEALPPLSVIVEHFLFTQDVRPQSRDLYRRTLKQFFVWVDSSGHDLGSLNRTHLLTYKQYLLDRGLSPLTVGSYITVLRLFYKFTSIEGIYKNIAEGIKPPTMSQSHRRGVLSDEEVKLLLGQLSKQGKRDRALGVVLSNTGMRTIEVSRLLIQDLVMRNGRYILLIHGKGRNTKDRKLTINQSTYTTIKEYLATRPGALPGEPMFISESNNSKGKPLSTRMISGIIKEALRACAIDDSTLTAHSLRHTFATKLRKSGVDIYRVSKALGHASIKTTEIYTKMINEELELDNPVTDVLEGIYN